MTEVTDAYDSAGHRADVIRLLQGGYRAHVLLLRAGIDSRNAIGWTQLWAIQRIGCARELIADWSPLWRRR